MSAKTERVIMIIGSILIITAVAYALITGDLSRLNNTYLG